LRDEFPTTSGTYVTQVERSISSSDVTTMSELFTAISDSVVHSSNKEYYAAKAAYGADYQPFKRSISAQIEHDASAAVPKLAHELPPGILMAEGNSHGLNKVEAKQREKWNRHQPRLYDRREIFPQLVLSMG